MTAEHVADVTDLEPGEAMRLELDGPDGSPLPVALVRDEAGEFHAISDICSHGQVNLSDGEVEGSTIECWLHGSTFDLSTGRPLSLPATQPVPVYLVTVDGERVLIDVDATADVVG
ncbi:non-heme iron oxygenase ferredoxin subunit [Georgenia sp. EYE_87]|jgi:3-phenylpropionate/trans-cinnamate dioxygenase ferredoxin subunit|uniref:non-heme iron oxygenase ferredoxin subunit n=1 Tax=Georgenia sp. EYE_87 TaxID=2853448 RepID=UPI002002DFAB|nr:non-heme iron oxygenase ferredoxin subunit [Georgenia sp. EYE_87]MCK6212163.1 non-heme iron oxygenase ferredoxin subunit [Georgenia sp. EYE_87]